MNDLLKRLEAATAGSRELDAEIAEATHPDRSLLGKMERAANRPVDEYGAGWNTDGVPHYTTSLDAALSLVPKGWEWQIEDGGYATVYAPSNCPDIDFISVKAATTELATLRARDGETG